MWVAMYPQGIGTVHLGNDALPVVENLETRHALLAQARDTNRASPGVQTILDELGERLSGIGLAER